MIGLFEIKEEIKKVPYKLHGQEVSARLEMSPKRKPLAKAHALFYKGLKEVGRNGSKIHVVYEKIQISSFVRSAMAAKYKKAGIANLMLLPQSVQMLALFEAIAKSSRRTRRIFRLNPGRHVNAWKLISVNINRQRSSDISTIKVQLLGPPHPAILSIQEMCLIWNCLDTCVTVANLVSQRCWFLKRFAQFRDHGSLFRDVQDFS